MTKHPQPPPTSLFVLLAALAVACNDGGEGANMQQPIPSGSASNAAAGPNTPSATGSASHSAPGGLAPAAVAPAASGSPAAVGEGMGPTSPGAPSAPSGEQAPGVDGPQPPTNAAVPSVAPTLSIPVQSSPDAPLQDAGSGEQTVLSPRTRLSLNQAWSFMEGDPPGTSGLSYAEAKAWVLPTGNGFVVDPAARSALPESNLGQGHPYLSPELETAAWQQVDLPHDYAIRGPYTNSISSSMGRLPSRGVAWYRKSIPIAAEDAGKSFFLDVDGAMSYSMVWVNGRFAGGWPYGYASYRVDITPWVTPGQDNVVTIRVDNPVPPDAQWDSGSSRWYPGAGIYRNVWLNVTEPVHVAHWGTFVTTPQVTDEAATVQLAVDVDNDTESATEVELSAQVFELDGAGAAVATLETAVLSVPGGGTAHAELSGTLEAPKRWGPPPSQQPNLYQVVTTLRRQGEVVDVYETNFGVRTLEFTGDQGLLVNGERVKLNGVCLHHDLGPLGAAFSPRARERQLEIMAAMGSNAIRTAHNPFEPEFYALADRMGLMVLDEAFDVWLDGKAALDHHVFFEDWYEQDLRALIRRDRNHPSVIMWSIGNEVKEQDDAAGPEWAERLTRICHEEDPTRPTTAGMNAAEPDNPFSVPIDTIGLNYQGTGVRDQGAQYPAYHDAFPEKFVFGTETTSTFSSRGVYLFPVTSDRGEPASGSAGVNASAGWVSSYDLYHADWSYSPDEEFESQDKWPYVGGEFVWTGFDYLGEPTPLDAVASSSYFGIVDIAGLAKDRFYLYQAYWRPEHAMAHILPHWTWPGREGQVTPVHVYTSGDSAELFLNGASLGRKTKAQYEYRLRWDDVGYEPGELAVVAYKDGQEWASAVVETAGAATQLSAVPDREAIAADGSDLAFLTISVLDAEGRLVPAAADTVTVAVSGPGQLVATANGDPTNDVVFASPERAAFSGKAVAIVRGLAGQAGEIEVTASAAGLVQASATVRTE